MKLTYEYVDKLLTKKGFKLIKVVENDFEDTDYLETNYIYQKGTVKLDINTCDDEVVFIMISDKHNHHQSLRLDKFDEYIRYNLLDYFEESKKSSRKSIKESRQSILDKRFYELVDEGYIYDEDEDGMNMSYGELVAVSDDLWETLEDELKYYDDFQEAYDVYMDIMDNTSDDAKMFMTGLDEYFYFDINEDEGTYSVDGEIPFILEKLFKKFQKETDFERV